MKKWNNILKQISQLSQLGLSIIIPTLLCMLLCSWLTGRFGVGEWVYIPGLILGLGSSFMTAYKFYLAQMRDIEKDKKEKKTPVGFNKHY